VVVEGEVDLKEVLLEQVVLVVEVQGLIATPTQQTELQILVAVEVETDGLLILQPATAATAVLV
jgi:hypothetical protein